MHFKGCEMGEQHRRGVGVGRGRTRRWRHRRWVESPLQKVDVRSCSLTAFETLGRLLRISAAIIGSRSREREDELRMTLGGPIDAAVCFGGNDGAK